MGAIQGQDKDWAGVDAVALVLLNPNCTSWDYLIWLLHIHHCASNSE